LDVFCKGVSQRFIAAAQPVQNSQEACTAVHGIERTNSPSLFGLVHRLTNCTISTFSLYCQILVILSSPASPSPTPSSWITPPVRAISIVITSAPRFQAPVYLKPVHAELVPVSPSPAPHATLHTSSKKVRFSSYHSNRRSFPVDHLMVLPGPLRGPEWTRT
jgi:hypothetical protein